MLRHIILIIQMQHKLYQIFVAMKQYEYLERLMLHMDNKIRYPINNYKIDMHP